MKTPRPGRSLVTGFGVALLGVIACAAKDGDGDKIEFTPPREPVQVRPLTGTDFDERPFNFQRKDPGAGLSEVPAAIALPAPDQVNRARALQEMIERRNDWARPESARDDAGMELSLQPEGAGTEFGIDDLFDRDRAGGDRLDRRGSGENPFDRSSDRDRVREGDRRGDDRWDRQEDGTAPNPSATGSKGASESKFLPGLSEGSRASIDPITGERRSASDNFMDFGSLVPRSASTLRETGEFRTREERMESFRRLLPAPAAPSGTGVSGTGSDLLKPVGVPGVSAPGPGANRSLSDALGGRNDGASTSPANEGLGGANRPLVIPSRPMELNVGSGRRGFGTDSERPALAPAPTPMQLFRQKHDSRIPTRAF